MTDADTLKIEIDRLKQELADLDNKRLERDHIASQLEKLLPELRAKEKELADLNAAVKKASEDKRFEEARINAEVEARLGAVSKKESIHRQVEATHRQVEQGLHIKAAALASQEAKLASDQTSVDERTKNLAKREESLQGAVSAHQGRVLLLDERESALVSRETAVKVRENNADLRDSHHTENVAALEAQWSLIHSANSELDLKKTKVEAAHSAAIEKESAAQAKLEEARLVVDAVTAASADLSTREQILVDKEKTHATIAQDLLLRELEVKAKERDLEKRQRIIILKETENAGQ